MLASTIWLHLPASGLSAAEIRLLQLGNIDGAHNGSIDLDTFMGSNLRDDKPIHCNLALDGRIVVGDFEKLKRVVKAGQHPRLCLNSPGGSYTEALRIAQLLMDESVGTALQENAVCASACAIIFMAGSAPWKGRLNRFMHPSSTLAFHAPYLSGGAGQRYEGGDIAAAFQAGLQAVSRLMKLADTTVPNFFPNELLREMLNKGPNETYGIDTVGKVIRYRIHLFGARSPAPLTEAIFCNACANHFFGNASICTGSVSRPKARSFPEGVRLEFDAAPRGGSCVIDLETSAGTIKTWFLHDHYPNGEKFGANSSALNLAYWYLYSADTPLAHVPRANPPAPVPRPLLPRPEPPPSVSIEQKIGAFIAQDYLGNGKINHVQHPNIFAANVHYYAKGFLPRSAILAERASYHKRWPYRRYDVTPGTIHIVSKDDGNYDVAFSYTFLVASGAKQVSGRGIASLTLQTSANKIEITREDGKVVERR